MAGCCRDKAKVYFDEMNLKRATAAANSMLVNTTTNSDIIIDDSKLSSGAKKFKEYLDSKK